MPDASSMIRTVPGGNVGPGGRQRHADDDGASATGSASPGRPEEQRGDDDGDEHEQRRARRPSAVRGAAAGGGSSAGGTGAGAGGRRSQDRRRCTATPGPAGVATSDQPTPFHQRTSPGVAVGVGVPAGRRGRLAGSGHGAQPRTAAYASPASTGRRRARCCTRRAPRPPSSPGCAPPGASSPRTRRACSWPRRRRPARARPRSCDRRVAGEPLEHLLGWAEFCGLRIAVDPGVFVPRRRTELLVARGRRARAGPARSSSTCAAAPGASAAALAAGARPASSCTPPTSTRPRWPARGATSPGGGRCTRATCSPRCPPALRGRVDVLVANVPYVPSDADRADAARGARPRAADRARRRRRRAGRRPAGGRGAPAGWRPAARCCSRSARPGAGAVAAVAAAGLRPARGHRRRAWAHRRRRDARASAASARAASSRHRWAAASAPRWSIGSSTRSFGEWMRSVGRPAPRNTSGAPSCLDEVGLGAAAALAGEQHVLGRGVEGLRRWRAAGRPWPGSRGRWRRARRRRAGCAPRPRCPAGRLASTQARSWRPTSSGRWSATSRKVTLACASAGMIVLWPGPV